MTVKSIWLRRIHKWVGLLIGLQFLLFVISGTAMALLDKNDVEGGVTRDVPAQPLRNAGTAWPVVQAALNGDPVSKITIRSLPSGRIYEITTPNAVRLFSARDGSPVSIDAAAARSIAREAHPENAAVKSVRPMKVLTLAVREHALPIWQVDFNDARRAAITCPHRPESCSSAATTLGGGGIFFGCSTTWTTPTVPASTTR